MEEAHMTSEGLRHPDQEPDQAAPGVGGTPYDGPATRATDPSPGQKADGSTDMWPSTATTSSGWEPAPAVGAASVASTATSWPAPTPSTPPSPSSAETSPSETPASADFPPDWGTPSNPYPPPVASVSVPAPSPAPETPAPADTDSSVRGSAAGAPSANPSSA